MMNDFPKVKRNLLSLTWGTTEVSKVAHDYRISRRENGTIIHVFDGTLPWLSGASHPPTYGLPLVALMGSLFRASQTSLWPHNKYGDAIRKQKIVQTARLFDIKTISKGCLCDEECESGFALECDRVLQLSGAPQKRYWKTYFVVSDFTQQHWCEQQLLYSLSPEVVSLRLLPEEEISLEESTAAKVQKGKGSDIHQARELEIQVPVVVKVETKEDNWAVKFLNLQSAVLAFHSGRRVAREVPVFGMPFGSDLFIVGIIDELTYDPVHHAIQISELKTRRSHRSPKKSQLDKDRYQVGLYAQLFNELVQGKITKEMVCSQLHLRMDMVLGKEIREHILLLDKSKCEDSCTLGCLLDTVLGQIQSLTCIMEAKIEYVHQETKAQIKVMEVELDPEVTQLEFFHHCEWWKGQRGTKGVDIEDCWKCEFCQFAPVCEWREVMASKLSKQIKKK